MAPTDPEEPSERSTVELSRRQLLELTALGSVSLAGCGGDQGATPTEGATRTPMVETEIVTKTVTGGDEVTRIVETVEVTPEETETATLSADDLSLHMNVNWNWAAGDTNFNREGPGNYPGSPGDFIFYTPLVQYSPISKEYVPIMEPSIPERDGCFVINKIDDGWTWWNGMEVNSYDRVYIHELIAHSCCGGPDGVPWVAEYVDDKTWREKKAGPVNGQWRARNMVRPIRNRRDLFKPFWERAQDASSEEELDQVITDLNEFEITLDQAMEQGHGTGLWKPVSYAADQITFEKFQEHPFADRTNLEKLVLHITTNSQSRLQAIDSDTLDIGQTPYRDQLDNPPGNLATLAEWPTGNGLKLSHNWSRTHGQNRAFRAAVAHLLDLEPLARIVTGNASPVKHQAAYVPENFQEQYLGESWLDNLIDYGVSAKKDKAKAVLQEGGYSKSGDIWVGPDGNETNGLVMITRSGGDRSLIGSTISGLLNNFGFKNDFLALETGSYGERVGNNANQQWDLDLTSFGTGASWEHANEIFVTGGAFNITTSGCDTVEPPEISPKTEVHRRLRFDWGTPGETGSSYPAVPREVGSTSGDTYRPDIATKSFNTRLDFSKEKLRSDAREIAWWFNYHVPSVHVLTTEKRLWYDSANFGVTSDRIYGGHPGNQPQIYGYLNRTM